MKTCVICGRDEVSPGKTTQTMTRGRATVVIRDVPPLVCESCGETYLEGEVVDRTLATAERLIRAGIEIAVSDYEAKTA